MLERIATSLENDDMLAQRAGDAQSSYFVSLHLKALATKPAGQKRRTKRKSATAIPPWERPAISSDVVERYSANPQHHPNATESCLLRCGRGWGNCRYVRGDRESCET